MYHLLSKLLCALSLFIMSTAQAIVIRHDVDDQLYQNLAKKFIASVVTLDGCVGTVIDKEWILTAAHCVSKQQNIPFLLQHLDRKYPVKEIYQHPNFSEENYQNDIALLQLEWPIENAEITSLYSEKNEINKAVFFVGNGGFGNGKDGVLNSRPIYRAATNTVVAVSESHLSFIFNANNNATALEGISGPQDSGGPALIERDNKLFIAGVSSWQKNRGVEGLYGVTEYYARVSTTTDWIQSTIKANRSIHGVIHPLITALENNNQIEIDEYFTKNTTWQGNSLVERQLLLSLIYQLPIGQAKRVFAYYPKLMRQLINGQPLAVYVIEHGNWPLLTLLIDAGVGLEHKNVYAESLLIQLLRAPINLKQLAGVLDKLLVRGFDINSRDDRGNTALALAVYLAHRDTNYESLQLLLDKGADLNIPANDGYTPLMYVAELGDEPLSQLLIKYGANIHLKDNAGKTALDYANDKNHMALTPILSKKNKL